MAGFSDRFSESILRSAVGKFGGEKGGELITMEMSTKQTRETLDHITYDAKNEKSTDFNKLIVTKDGVQEDSSTSGDGTSQVKVVETKEMQFSQAQGKPESE